MNNKLFWILGKTEDLYMRAKSYEILHDDRAHQYDSNATIPYVLEWSGDFLQLSF